MINKLNPSNVLLNTLSIGSFQFANYFLPILMVPFLIRALGLDLYGSFAILYAILSFLNLMVEYGFNVLATKDVALMQNNESKISQYFSNVMFTKLSIFILILLLSFICLIAFESKLFTHYYLLLPALLGNLLIPQWLFQGLEKVLFASLVNLVTKTIFFLLIIFTVLSPNDFTLLLLLFTSGAILSGILCFIYAVYRFKIKLQYPNLNACKILLKNGFPLAISAFSTQGYSSLLVVILGQSFNHGVVGLYSSVERVSQLLKAIFIPFSQSLIPYTSKIVKYEANFKCKIIKPFVIPLMMIMLLVIIMICFEQHIFDILSVDMSQLSNINFYYFLLIGVIFTAIGNIFGVHYLINSGKQNIFGRVILLVGLVSIVLALLLIPIYGINAAAFISMAAEAIIAFGFLCIVFIKRVNIR